MPLITFEASEVCATASAQRGAPSLLPPLPGMTEMSQMLSQDARQFAVKAKDLYHQALLRKYLPIVVVVGVLLLILLLRGWFR